MVACAGASHIWPAATGKADPDLGPDRTHQFGVDLNARAHGIGEAMLSVRPLH